MDICGNKNMIASGDTQMSGPSGRGRGPGLGRAEEGGTEEGRLSYSSPWQLGDLAKQQHVK